MYFYLSISWLNNFFIESFSLFSRNVYKYIYMCSLSICIWFYIELVRILFWNFQFGANVLYFITVFIAWVATFVCKKKEIYTEKEYCRL